MCAKLPRTKEELLGVKGIGAAKQERYGARLLHAIAEYLESNPSYTPAINVQEPPKEKAAKQPSHLVTYEMYQQGNSLQEIAALRQLSRITIENHIVQCLEEGLPVSWEDILTPEQEALIQEAALRTGTEKLKPIKDELPPEITYFMIKAALVRQRQLCM
ncbi:MAG: helix-turn-helix domain-containing protein [Ectobacillus sp.]